MIQENENDIDENGKSSIWIIYCLFFKVLHLVFLQKIRAQLIYRCLLLFRKTNLKKKTEKQNKL